MSGILSELLTVLSLTSFVLSAIALCLSIRNAIEIKAMQKSTHQVQFVRTGPDEFEKMTDELKEQLTKDPFENI